MPETYKPAAEYLRDALDLWFRVVKRDMLQDEASARERLHHFINDYYLRHWRSQPVIQALDEETASECRERHRNK